MDYHRHRINAETARIQQFLQSRDDVCAEVLHFSGEFEEQLLELEHNEGIDGIRDHFEVNATHVSISSTFFPFLCRRLQCLQYYTHTDLQDVILRFDSTAHRVAAGRTEKEQRTLRAWIVREGSTAIDVANRFDGRLAR